MRNLKKVLALVLAMAMSLSLAVTAGAAFNDQDKIVNDEAVDMCSALNIINGYTDGSFKPEGNVTRAEAAKMITIALNGGKEPTLSASATPTYSDIAGHWAAKYIEYCTSLGIVAGDGAGKFNPNGNVKAVELAKMLLIAIGYEADAEKFVGANWDTNVNVVASQKDLYEDLESIDPAVAATRDTAAQMVWNALNVLMVDYTYKLSTDGNGNLVSELKVYDLDQTLMEKKFDTIPTDETTGVLAKAEYNDKDEEYTYELADGSKFVTEANYVELLGQDVTFVAKDFDDVFGAFSNSVVVASDLYGNFEKCTKENDCIKIDGVEYDMTVGAFDNNLLVASTVDHKATLGAGTVEKYDAVNAIDMDDDGDIDAFIAVGAKFADVTYVGKDYINTTIGKLEAEDYSIYEGVEKEDVVMVSGDMSLVTLGTVTEVEKLTGKIESRSGDNVTIAGTVYDYSLVPAANITNNMSKDVEFYAYNGYLLSVEVTTSVDITEYAIVTDIAGKAGLTGPQAELLFTDGTSQVVDLADEYNFAVGTMVEFDIDDGEYELAAVASLDADAFDAINATAFVPAESSADADAKIAFGAQNAKFAADAVIFVYDTAEDEYVVKTGADVAKITGAATVNYAGAEKNSNNALTVTFAYVETAGVSDSDAIYAYVVSDVTFSENADNEEFQTVTVWNGEKDVDLTTAADKDLFSALKEGDLVSYKVDADGAVTSCEVVAAGDAVALTVIDGDFVTIAGTEYEIDEDTVVLYVDASEEVGEEGGAISVATETETEGVYYANVKFVSKDGKVLDLLVVDVDNDWNGDLD